jgi:GT2 family glycosyltransferase
MISIVIIVKNDRDIESTIKELLVIDKPDQEVEILVVDSSDPEKLKDIKEKYSNDVRWLYFKNTNPNRKYTIPEQRNMGIREAKGDIIVYIDANCIPEKDWLIEITKYILLGEENIVAGPVKSLNTTTINDLPRMRNTGKKYLEECPTINLAFNKSVVDKVGYFDETFDYGSDVDFSWRAIDAGYKIRYNENALISHDWGHSKRELKRTLQYGKARGHLYLKHSNRRKYLYRDPVVVIYPLFLLGLPLILIFPWYPLLLLILVAKNYRDPNPFETVLKHLVYGVGCLHSVYKYYVN